SEVAPGGNSKFPMINPRSSLGTNPLGIVLFAKKIPTPHKAKIKNVIHLCLKRNPKLCAYFRVTAVNPLLNPAKKRWKIFFFFFSCPSSGCFKNKAHRAGLSVNAFTAE